MTFRGAAPIALWSLVYYYVWDTSVAVNVLPNKSFTLTEEKPEEYIESPNYPYDYYPNDTQITYRVEVKLRSLVPQVPPRVQVTFEVFLMEMSSFCRKDVLDLDNMTGERRVYCGAQSGRHFLMEGRIIVMRMSTDATGRDRGFRIRVKLYQSPCGGRFQQRPFGSITSPGYPRSYGADTLCVWRITAPLDLRITLKFTGQFDIRSDNNDTCFNDYLEISRTGNFETDSRRYCGKMPPTTIVSKTSRLMLKFVSDCCEEGPGFNLSFEVVPASSVEPSVATDMYRPISCQLDPCGTAQLPIPRHVGEEEYPAHKYPWMVAIFDRYRHYICSGSLIALSHVLTAAHCCMTETRLRVKIGVHHLREGPFFKVKRCVMHPAYMKSKLVNNIAVLILKQRVPYNQFQRPICLPIDAEDMPGINGTIAGWSNKSYDGRYKQIPEEVTVPFISHPKCVEGFGALILPSNLCAGGGTADSCQGENGGPLMSTWHSRGKVLQIGIVTTGVGCGRRGNLGIYTRTTPYHDFVYNITRQRWCSVRPPSRKKIG